MTKFVLLDHKEHRDLKVITERSARYGDNVQYAMVHPFEFRDVVAHYPILFQKDRSSGRLFPLVLFGFDRDENLFLDDQGWDAPYVPIMIRREPFLIGLQRDPDNLETQRAMISIDIESPRLSKTDGEALFDANGGATDFLKSVSANLETIQRGHEQSTRFVEALVEHELLESLSVEFTLPDGSAQKFDGFLAVNESSVRKLDGKTLAALNEQGVLQPLFMVLASLPSVNHLIARKSARLPT